MPSRTRGHGPKGMEAAMPLVDLGSYKGPLGLVSVMGVTVKPAGNWMADGEDKRIITVPCGEDLRACRVLMFAVYGMHVGGQWGSKMG